MSIQPDQRNYHFLIMATINDHCWPEPIVPVQTLSNSGVPTVPQQYIKPPSERPCGSITSMNSPDLSIPIIDLACFYDISEHPLLQESICAAWPKWAPWRAPLLPTTVNRWPATEAPAAGKGFTVAGHLTCPPQEIVI